MCGKTASGGGSGQFGQPAPLKWLAKYAFLLYYPLAADKSARYRRTAFCTLAGD